jgi:hypothetical protein
MEIMNKKEAIYDLMYNKRGIKCKERSIKRKFDWTGITIITLLIFFFISNIYLIRGN